MDKLQEYMIGKRDQAARPLGVSEGGAVQQAENVTEWLDRRINRLGDEAEKLRISRDRLKRAGMGEMSVGEFHSLFRTIL